MDDWIRTENIDVLSVGKAKAEVIRFAGGHQPHASRDVGNGWTLVLKPPLLMQTTDRKKAEDTARRAAAFLDSIEIPTTGEETRSEREGESPTGTQSKSGGG